MFEGNKSEFIRANKNEIEFIENSHTYLVDGMILPSVTQIMKPLSKDHYQNIPKSVMEVAGKRGQMVHLAVEMWEGFNTPPPDEIKDYLLQYKIAKKLHKFEVIGSELLLTNGEYCGTIDMLGLLDGDLILVDLKATASIHYHLLEVQMAGYMNLLKYLGYEIKKCYVLHLTKKKQKFDEIIPNYDLWEVLWNEYKSQM